MNGIAQGKKNFTLQAIASCVLSLAVIVVLYFVLTAQEPGASGPPRSPLLLGFGILLIVLSWAMVARQGLRLLEVSTARPAAAAPVKKEDKAPVAPPPPPQPTAAELLSSLQRQGRLIDFLHEDLAQYEDAQIGAAVRSVHSGCKEVLSEGLKLEPILTEAEGSPISVPPGFDPATIRLVGNVTGRPPFRGTVQHRGWRDAKASRVLAPAEVEVHG